MFSWQCYIYLVGFFLDKWLFEDHGKTFVFLVFISLASLDAYTKYLSLFLYLCNSLFNPFLQKFSLSWLGSDFLAETGQTSDCLGSGETGPIVQCWFWTLERTQHLYSWELGSVELCMWETGLGLGTLLQCLHSDTALLKLQNTKQLFGVKNNNIRGQGGRFWTKDTKRPKGPTASSEEPGAKAGGSVSAFCTQFLLEVSDYLGLPSGTLTPGKEPVCSPQCVSKGTLLLVLAPSCGSRGPSKASFAWVSCLVSDQFLLMKGGKTPWSVTYAL